MLDIKNLRTGRPLVTMITCSDKYTTLCTMVSTALYLLGHGHMPANYRKSLAMCDFLPRLSNVVVSVILKSLSANNDQICQHTAQAAAALNTNYKNILMVPQHQLSSKYGSFNKQQNICPRIWNVLSRWDWAVVERETQSKPEAQQDTKRHQSFFKTTKTRE